MVSASAAPQLNLRLHVHEPAGPQLVRDYCAGAASIAPFFAGFPRDRAAIERVAADVQGQMHSATRRAMSDAVFATSEKAGAKLERIAAGDGFFVATGQQAGLFGGPLFTVYKTLTAMELARAYEVALGVPVAPLFWVAADDHDFAEVNHTHVFGADNEIRRLEVEDSGEVARSMNLRPLGDGVTAAVEALAATLPANEFSEQVLEWIRTLYVPQRSVAGAFSGLIKRMFAGQDLLITSSAHPIVKSLAAPVILRELERSREHEAAVRRQTDRLLAAGYHEQVTVRPDAANVLYEDENGRDRLVRENGNWHLSRTKRQLENADLHEMLTLQPERFSPNVLLRPVVASAVFPTLAYVGGPAEVSYFAQIGCLFDAHEVPMPLVQPRVSVEIIEHKVQKVLDKFALDMAAVRQPFDQLASQVIRDELPESVSGTVERLRQEIAAGYAELVAATGSIDPTLRGPLESARNASHKALADVEKKLVSHLKKKNEIGIEQLRKASSNLFPGGEPQERVISALSYVARYGTSFMDAISAQIEISVDAAAPEWQGVVCG